MDWRWTTYDKSGIASLKLDGITMPCTPVVEAFPHRTRRSKLHRSRCRARRTTMLGGRRVSKCQCSAALGVEQPQETRAFLQNACSPVCFPFSSSLLHFSVSFQSALTTFFAAISHTAPSPSSSGFAHDEIVLCYDSGCARTGYHRSNHTSPTGRPACRHNRGERLLREWRTFLRAWRCVPAR